jgi:hypothetical protein
MPSFLFGVEWNWVHHYWGHYCLTVFFPGSRIYTLCKPLVDFTHSTLDATFNCSTYVDISYTIFLLVWPTKKVKGFKMGDFIGYSSWLITHVLKTSSNAFIELFRVWALYYLAYNAHAVLHHSVEWSRMAESVSHNFKTYCFMQNHVPSYPLHTNLTPNPKFDFMQWHVINSIRIICSPVSVILVVHVTT